MTASRIAFLDVDGTILDHGSSVAASTVAAIRGARAAGHLVYLCTGRSASDIHPDVAAIGFDGAITNGGAYATSAGATVVDRTMPPEAVDRLLAWAERTGYLLFLQSSDAIFASASTGRTVEKLMRRWGMHHDRDEPQSSPQRPPMFHDLAVADRSRMAKAVFLSDDTDAVERARADLGDAFHVVPGSMPLPGGSNGEIGLRDVTKGSAIADVLAHLARDAADAIGIGDSWNDVEMFEVCGVGIAMGNADPALKEIADEVTTSVREDGVHAAFVRHGLI
ncbi:Cof-type HAD-IIB family hydrolase [Microbacterium hominis]|uniref:Cof-type HAD-IIB family hydrolase n=1 Tax=Microbacterium hominis TaxID=162426 RepID=A0A7D4PVN9_9MICO|nr:Cof-type HAD-IIB family hydrolase [Microbacterium hominis]QKJ20733.1 Cof-type HAD-IIB family hydrolase [Microbacterium hominis]